MPAVTRGFLDHVEHDEAQVREVDPPFLPPGIRLPWRVPSSAVAAITVLRRWISSGTGRRRRRPTAQARSATQRRAPAGRSRTTRHPRRCGTSSARSARARCSSGACPGRPHPDGSTDAGTARRSSLPGCPAHGCAADRGNPGSSSASGSVDLGSSRRGRRGQRTGALAENGDSSNQVLRPSSSRWMTHRSRYSWCGGSP